MSYVESYTLTKVYWKEYLAKYFEVYEHVYNKMKDLYSKEDSLSAAVATAMIAFSKASGMDMAGIITWDETVVEGTPEFTTFVEQKAYKQPSAPTSTQAPVSGYQKPSGGGYQKKTYDGPTELKGPASEKQVNKIHEFLNDQDAKVQKIVVEALADMNVASPEELGKQDASTIIQLGFDAKKKGSYRKN